jgi:hypothetical protein
VGDVLRPSIVFRADQNPDKPLTSTRSDTTFKKLTCQSKVFLKSLKEGSLFPSVIIAAEMAPVHSGLIQMTIRSDQLYAGSTRKILIVVERPVISPSKKARGCFWGL